MTKIIRKKLKQKTKMPCAGSDFCKDCFFNDICEDYNDEKQTKKKAKK